MDIARELLSNKPNITRCRESVKLLNAHLLKNTEDRNEAAKQHVDTKLLRDTFHLAPSEIDYLKDVQFTGVDAHYLQMCLQMRDIARALRLARLADLEKARRGFAWAMRQVVLQSTREEMLPPLFVLQRGKGSGQERALVFLALMQQLGLPGCMIAVPGGEGAGRRYLLAGVLLAGASKQKPAIYLFDPRLGTPVPGSKPGAVATLDYLRRNPDCLSDLSVGDWRYDIDAGQAKQADVYLVCPLSSLSSRMRYLEEKLKRKTAVRLALSAEDTLRQLQEVAGEAAVWNSPAKGNRLPETPLRALRSALPAEEGGTGSGRRLAKLSSKALSYTSMVVKLKKLGVYDRLPDDLNERLDKLIYVLFSRYVDAPRQHLLHGRWGREFSQPLVRLGKAMRAHRRSRFQDDAKQQKVIANWVREANAAYLAQLDKKHRAEQRANKVWAMDSFLRQLIVPGKEGDRFGSNVQQSVLTYLLLEAVEQPITKERVYLMALCWLEKAERSQMELDLLRGENKPIPGWRRKDAADNWANAVGSAAGPGESRQYTAQYPISASAVRGRLAQLRMPPTQILLGLLEELFDDIHRTAAVRMHIGDGLSRWGATDEAGDVWRKLQDDLVALMKESELRKRLADFGKAIAAERGVLPPSPQDLPSQLRLSALNDMQKRLDALKASLGARGSLTWYAHAAALRVKHGKKVLP